MEKMLIPICLSVFLSSMCSVSDRTETMPDKPQDREYMTKRGLPSFRLCRNGGNPQIFCAIGAE